MICADVDRGVLSIISLFITGAFEAAALVTEVLRELYSNEQACELCLCRDDIMSTVLSPIAQFLDESSVSQL